MLSICRLDCEEPELVNHAMQTKPAAVTHRAPKPSVAPVLLVVPAQPQVPSVLLHRPSCSSTQFISVALAPALPSKPSVPNKSSKLWGACQVLRCGGHCRRYTPSKDKTAGSTQKIFTYCPATQKSTTSGFDV